MESIYDQVIALDPQDALAYRNRGVAYYKQGDLDRAIADFTRAIELDPDNGTAFYARGTAYAEAGEKEKAIADLEQALKLGLNPEREADARAQLEELRK